MKTLHLTLKKKWFDMILSGEKKEEYREIKTYWEKRLRPFFSDTESKKQIIFKNGYSKNAREMTVEFLGIKDGFTKIEWSGFFAPAFVLSLGRIIKTKNCK